ncbi:hypothetical protein DITRI_Ditri16bG0027900 [Diplodiscus trichospermus]
MKMDSRIPRAQEYFSDHQKAMNVNNPEEKDAQTAKAVSIQLQIKSSGRSSPEALDKEVVLRRIRHHKCKTIVKSAFQALVGSSAQAQEKWMELGDAFTCP